MIHQTNIWQPSELSYAKIFSSDKLEKFSPCFCPINACTTPCRFNTFLNESKIQHSVSLFNSRQNNHFPNWLCVIHKILIINSSTIIKTKPKLIQTSSELISIGSELISTGSELIRIIAEQILTRCYSCTPTVCTPMVLKESIINLISLFRHTND